MCVKQIEGCNRHDASGKCLECGNGRVVSPDGMKCEVPPPPPPPPPPPGGGGGGGGSCPAGQTRQYLGSRSACCPNGYDLGDRGCFKPTQPNSCPAGQVPKTLGPRKACCPIGYDLGDRGCFKPTVPTKKPNGAGCTNSNQCMSGFCNTAIGAGPGGNGGLCSAR